MKSYKQFINESKNSIESICKKYGITDYIINEDGSIDVNGDVDLRTEKLTNIPLKFGKVNGYFACSFNRLISLEGCPESVGGDFGCSFNKLTSLEGCPEIISGDFDCSSNFITNFKGISEFFEGIFYCYRNPIIDIYHLFNKSHDYLLNQKCIKWINEFDVIQGNNIIMDRLEEVFHQLDMEIPQNIKFKNYEII